MIYKKLKNHRGELIENVELLDFVVIEDDDEKNIESHFKTYIESSINKWILRENYNRNNDISRRYNFRNERKNTRKGKPDYIFYNIDKSILAICDVKSTRIGVTEGIADAKDYVDCLNQDYQTDVRIAIAFDGRDLVIEFRSDSGWERVLIGDNELCAIPTPELLAFISKSQNKVGIVDETSVIERELLRNFFRKCDEIIRQSDIGTSATEKFIELSSIIFLKMFSLKGYDRDWKAKGNLAVWELVQAGLNSRINSDFLEWLNAEYKNLFPNEQYKVLTKMKSEKLKEISRLIDKLFSTYELTDFTNIKGDILEYFQMESKDRKIGEFFTPRHIVQLMVALIDPRVFKFGKDGIYIEKVYDPACGTGGFLIEVFSKFKRQFSSTINDMNLLKNDIFHGTELKANTALLAKLNMILIGDGHNNIVNANAFHYIKKEILPLKKDVFGNYIPIPDSDVDSYNDGVETIFHVRGDRTRKVTNEPSGKLYWAFDEFGGKLEVPEKDIITVNKKKLSSDGSAVKKVGGTYYKQINVRHFELKNDLQEEKIPYKYEDILSVNPALQRETLEGGKINPVYHKHFGNFDIVLANQPFGLSEPPKADNLFLNHMLSSLHADVREQSGRYGRMSCILGNGFLHDPNFYEERKKLQEQFFIKAVISLPQKVFAPYVKTIKSNILIIEKRRPTLGERTYFVKIEHDGYSQDDKRVKDDQNNELKKLLKLWKKWEYSEIINPETGLSENQPIHEELEGFAEYHILDAKSWAVNNYIKYKLPSFSCSTVSLHSYIEEISQKKHPKDIAEAPIDAVEIKGVSKKYGIITSDNKPACEYNQSFKILPSSSFAYNPSRINVGSIAYHTGSESLISPSYVVFKQTTDDFLSNYIYFFLRSSYGKKQIENYNNGTVRNSLNFDDLCKLEIPFLKKDKQESLMLLVESSYRAQINLIDSFKSLTKIGIPDAMFESGYKQDDEFVTVTLNDVIKDSDNPSYGISIKSDNDDNGTYILKMNNIFPTIDDIISEDELDKISISENDIEKYSVSYNDILINRTNSYEMVGKSGIFKNDIEAVYASYLMKITIRDGYSPDYIAFYLNLSSTRRKIRDNIAVQSNGQFNVNLENLKTLEIKYPKSENLLEHYMLSFNAYCSNLKGISQMASSLENETSSMFDKFLNCHN